MSLYAEAIMNGRDRIETAMGYKNLAGVSDMFVRFAAEQHPEPSLTVEAQDGTYSRRTSAQVVLTTIQARANALRQAGYAHPYCAQQLLELSTDALGRWTVPSTQPWPRSASDAPTVQEVCEEVIDEQNDLLESTGSMALPPGCAAVLQEILQMVLFVTLQAGGGKACLAAVQKAMQDAV